MAVTERRTMKRPSDAVAIGGKRWTTASPGRYETFPADGSPEDCQTAGVSLHPQARELVEHGGDRVQRPVPLLPEAAAPGEEALRGEVDALVTERNAARATINWRFNTRDARTKLHRLYPSDFTVD